MPTLFTRACCTGFSLFLLAACGPKPDGTPYGVNEQKHPDGHRITASAGNSPATSTEREKMPRGAELNAVTNSARAGQPLPSPAQTTAPAQSAVPAATQAR